MTIWYADNEKLTLDAAFGVGIEKKVQIGNTLEVVIGITDSWVDAEIEKKVAKGLKDGKEIRRPDGSLEWIEYHEIIDPNKKGSARYTWSKNGKRIKNERIHVCRDAAGNVTRTVEGTSYVLI